MVNEVYEVKNYLEGKNVNKNNLYRICYLLAKWFKEKGLSHIEIRSAIFDWAKKNKMHINYNLNSIIYRALEEKTRLKDNIIIKINQNDIDEINKRFDSKNSKLVALAVLAMLKLMLIGIKHLTYHLHRYLTGLILLLKMLVNAI